MKRFIYTILVVLFVSVLASCSVQDNLEEINIDSIENQNKENNGITNTQAIGKTDNVNKGNPLDL